jgi:hypothetical protein
MQIKTSSLRAIVAPADQRTKEGYYVDAAGAIVASAVAAPHGLIVDGGNTGEVTTIAPCAGGAPGTFSAKLAAVPGNVVKGSRLVLVNDGTVKLDPGEGDRVIVAEACEAGAANELVEVIPICPPIVIDEE